MNNCEEDLQLQIIKCRNLVNKGYSSAQNSKISWLNSFCVEFLKFAQHLHTILSALPEDQKVSKIDHVQIIYLSLTQIVTCIKHMENTINAEELQGATILCARQHFLDRINWCLDSLHSCLKSSESIDKTILTTEDKSFVSLMDQVLNSLLVYSNYNETESSISQIQALLDNQEIRSNINLILGHTLAFANVALEQDKKALSALCQKVLRECIEFQKECLSGVALNENNRRLMATSLESALHQLEKYINDALLRLIYTCFLDFNKFSIDKLRTVIREQDADDKKLDELIADFDVNVDRTIQIGMFGIAFATNTKIKTIIRSCLASFESLDSCIIPSLQTKGTSDIFAQLLEKHFNEEVTIFKNSIQEIMDSHAFALCFLEELTEAINHNGKTYDKESLEDILKKGEILYEHYQMPRNYKKIQKDPVSMEFFEKFHIILQECKAVLKCTTLQIEPQRVLKRFKILRSILSKLFTKLSDENVNDIDNKSQVFLMSDDEFANSQHMLSSQGITPITTSVLYKNSLTENRRTKRLLNDTLKLNISELSTSSVTKTPDVINAIYKNGTAPITTELQPRHYKIASKNLPASQMPRSSLRKKESLRTALFKRKQAQDTAEIYAVYKIDSDNNLQISEILDQLTCLSSNLSKSAVNEWFASN